MEGEAMHKTQILSLSSLQMMLYLEKQMRPGGGGLYFTVSWMLKVTRGPGEAPSTRTSGKSSTSPILELRKRATETDVSLLLLDLRQPSAHRGQLFQRARRHAGIQG